LLSIGNFGGEDRFLKSLEEELFQPYLAALKLPEIMKDNQEVSHGDVCVAADNLCDFVFAQEKLLAPAEML
jgi:hypothetical protein